MARTKLTTDGIVDLTVEEEAARDAEETAFAETQTPEYTAARKEIEAALLLGRAIDATFLDGHWITLRALDGTGITTGVGALDTAVAANDRAAFDIFFRDQVKARL